MSMSIPTSAGPYWWRAREDCEWDLVYVREVPDCGLIALWPETGVEIDLPDMRGQWAKVHTPDELATLRAKAEAYDNGTEAWFVLDVEDQTAIAMSTVNRGEATAHAWKALGMDVQHGCPGGFTCRKVRVCEEVEQ